MKTIRNYQVRRMLVVTGMAFSSFFLFAANSATVTGQVTDSNNQPVEYATAVLNNSSTGQFISGAVCNDKGEYIIENVEPGEYILSTNMIGYEKKTEKITVKANQPTVVKEDVVMNENPEKSITVVAKKLNGNQTAER